LGKGLLKFLAAVLAASAALAAVSAVQAGDNDFIARIDTRGQQIATLLLDTTGVPQGVGALFGLACNSDEQIVFVDDITNTLNLIH
jgi:hypothetical protein